MKRLLLIAVLWPLAARAGEADCWFEAGVLVAPAQVAGVSGDYVIDTGAPTTLLADTQAQAAGYADTNLSGQVQLAGQAVENQPIAVARLDARFWGLSTPVAGVIGMDLLKAYVLDVRFAPCRIALWRAGETPAVAGGQVQALSWSEGRPAVQASVTDGVTTASGPFVLATGSDTPVRLRDDAADAPGAAKREGLYPYGPLRPKLKGLTLLGDLFAEQPAGLVAKSDLAALGQIGAPVLSHYRLRFDFPAGMLVWLKATPTEKGPPDRSDGPP